ncbi:SocA family protein [bacterium]|nr:SocA family protein [bacterium]
MRNCLSKLSAQNVADYYLSLPDEEAGDLISNLKLQKLCYYAQAFYLALHSSPLFNDQIEAWNHGPVIKNLYHKYKDYGATGIPSIKKLDLSVYPEIVCDLLNEIYKIYGQYSAWRLRDLTHQEPPWKEAYEMGATVISHESMENHFKTLIVTND